jgi:hypothetical protein
MQHYNNEQLRAVENTVEHVRETKQLPNSKERHLLHLSDIQDACSNTHRHSLLHGVSRADIPSVLECRAGRAKRWQRCYFQERMLYGLASSLESPTTRSGGSDVAEHFGAYRHYRVTIHPQSESIDLLKCCMQ